MKELIRLKVDRLREIFSPNSFGGVIVLIKEKKLILTSIEIYEAKEYSVGLESLKESLDILYEVYNNWETGRIYGDSIKEAYQIFGFLFYFSSLSEPINTFNKVNKEDLFIEKNNLLTQNKDLKNQILQAKENLSNTLQEEEKLYKKKEKELEEERKKEMALLEKVYLQTMEAIQERQTEEVKGIQKMAEGHMKATAEMEIAKNNAQQKKREKEENQQFMSSFFEDKDTTQK